MSDDYSISMNIIIIIVLLLTLVFLIVMRTPEIDDGIYNPNIDYCTQWVDCENTCGYIDTFEEGAQCITWISDVISLGSYETCEKKSVMNDGKGVERFDDKKCYNVTPSFLLINVEKIYDNNYKVIDVGTCIENDWCWWS